MKTAISVPDEDFTRFEAIAARHGMTRSEFYQRAGRNFADELEGGRSQLTDAFDAALKRVGQPAGDGAFISQAERLIEQNAEW